MPTLEQATEARLQEIRNLVESGVTEMTGKGRRDSSGAFVGRFGGLKPMFPELEKVKDTPGQIAKAIRRGQGRPYERVYKVVSDAMAVEGYAPARKRSRGRTTILPHAGKAYCVHCREIHTKGEHRFHGPGSFHDTHLFAFGGNPLKLSEAKRRFALLMKVSRRRSLTEHERVQLRRASQAIRYEKRAGRNPRKKRAMGRAFTSFQCPKCGGSLRSTRDTLKCSSCPYEYASQRKPKRKVKSNPVAGLVRMGKLVEIRYERDHGKKPGFYKHQFKGRPVIYWNRSTNTIVIRGVR